MGPPVDGTPSGGSPSIEPLTGTPPVFYEAHFSGAFGDVARGAWGFGHMWFANPRTVVRHYKYYDLFTPQLDLEATASDMFNVGGSHCSGPRGGCPYAFSSDLSDYNEYSRSSPSWVERMMSALSNAVRNNAVQGLGRYFALSEEEVRAQLIGNCGQSERDIATVGTWPKYTDTRWMEIIRLKSWSCVCPPDGRCSGVPDTPGRQCGHAMPPLADLVLEAGSEALHPAISPRPCPNQLTRPDEVLQDYFGVPRDESDPSRASDFYLMVPAFDPTRSTTSLGPSHDQPSALTISCTPAPCGPAITRPSLSCHHALVAINLVTATVAVMVAMRLAWQDAPDVWPFRRDDEPPNAIVHTDRALPGSGSSMITLAGASEGVGGAPYFSSCGHFGGFFDIRKPMESQAYFPSTSWQSTDPLSMGGYSPGVRAALWMDPGTLKAVATPREATSVVTCASDQDGCAGLASASHIEPRAMRRSPSTLAQ